ncbi:zinc-binding dehydrogenase [Microlunatus elymi]|nr:zinc-binding dehydrogenase [Microlunatus elymi]
MRAVVSSTVTDRPNVSVADVPVPLPEAGQVQVKLSAAGVNPVALVTADPAIVRRLGVPALPDQVGLGWDLAGVVSAVGAGVTVFEIGRPVIGLVDKFITPIGAQSEYVVLDTHAVAALPDGADLLAAATLPANASTARQPLRLAGAQSGDAVVVTGAAGAVGAFAVEIGSRLGYRMIGVARPADEELVRCLGAAEFVAIDPVAADDPAAAVRAVVPDGADVIIDAAILVDKITGALVEGGSFVAVNDAAVPTIPGAKVHKVSVRADADDLAAIVADWRAGRLTARVAEQYRFEQVAEAHDRLRAGGVRGRLLLAP